MTDKDKDRLNTEEYFTKIGDFNKLDYRKAEEIVSELTVTQTVSRDIVGQ